MNILLVEDHPDNLLALEAILASLNETLVVANSGEQALKHVLDRDFAVILMDIHLQGINGLDTARLIKAREESRQTPIIFLTGYDHGEMQRFEGYSIGAVDYLVKPIVPEVLLAKVSVFIDLYRKTETLQQRLEEVTHLKQAVQVQKRTTEEYQELLVREQSARSQAQAAQMRMTFLAQVSGLLASSLDYQTTLATLANLIVPTLSDWCAVEIVEAPGVLRKVALRHSDPAQIALAEELERRYPARPEELQGRWHALHTGKVEHYQGITEAMLAQGAEDAEHYRLLRELGFTSALIVPLIAHDRRLGVLTMTQAESGRHFGESDVALVQELAYRAALALDNALLYREMNEQRERLQVTLTSIGDAVIATDRLGSITFMNPVAEALTGWQQAEAAGKSLQEVFPIINETTHQRVESPVDQVLREGAIIGLANHTLLIARDGREIPIDDSGAPIRDDKNAIVGVILVFRDVTERRQIEDERTQLLEKEHQARVSVQAANQKLQFLTQVSTTLVSSLDYETTLANLAQLLVPHVADNCVIDLITTNASLERVAVAATDPVREEALRELARRFPPDPMASSTRQSVMQKTPRLVPQLTDAYYDAAAQNAEHLALMKASGGKSLLIVPLVVGERSLGAISLGMVDSGRSYSEADLDLMSEVAHRAAFAVEHARLYQEAQQEIRRREQAEQALQAAVQSRDEFLSVAAHELKTPVTSLRGFAQTLLRQLDKRGTLEMAQVERALYVIDQQSTKLTTLVSQLLDISRLEAGRLTLERTVIDLPDLIAGIIANIQRGKQYPIVLQAPATLPASVDPLRLEQVIVNLIDNAMKYSPNREPIQVELSALNPQLVQITVRDHGLGIPPERREHLFERFYQAHRDGYQGGMGLGLYISQQIVELHGGQILTEFPQTGGSVFVVQLPVIGQELPQ